MRPLVIASASTVRKAASTVRILPRVTIVSAACCAGAPEGARMTNRARQAVANVRIAGFYRLASGHAAATLFRRGRHVATAHLIWTGVVNESVGTPPSVYHEQGRE